MTKNSWLALVLCLMATPGCVYTNITQPLDTDIQRTEMGSKVGEAHAYQILGLVAWGDRGTKAAADAGGITVVQHMDLRTLTILGFIYGCQTTIVYGD